MGLSKLIFVFAACAFLPIGFAAGEPAAPAIQDPAKLIEPAVPEEPKPRLLPAVVTFASGEKLKGVIYPETPFFYISAGSAAKEKLSLPWESVAGVKLLRWKAAKSGSGYFFTAAEAMVETQAGDSLKCGALPQSFGFTDSFGKKRKLFTCFYAYKKNGKWEATGASDDDYLTKNPHPETLVEIKFEKQEVKEMKNFLPFSF